jgi:hypothetical protein
MPAGNFGMCWELPTWNMSVAGLEISFQGAEAVSLQLDSLSSVFIRIARGRVTELQQSCNRAATELQQSCNRAATELQQITWHCIRIASGMVTRE